MSKAQKKTMKAVYQVHIGMNVLDEHGMYNYDRAKRRAKSYHYWRSK